MNVEEIRLQSFSNWPIDAPIDPSCIAKCGFYATGNGFEVQCHWCGSKINEWNYGDQVGFRFFVRKVIYLSIYPIELCIIEIHI